MSIQRARFIFVLIFGLLLLAACSNEESPTQKEDKQEDQFEIAVKEKNESLELEPLELTNYGEEVGAELTEPIYNHFATSEFLTIEGTIEQHEQLKGSYVWIKIRSNGEAVSSKSIEYYAPITDGAFKQKIALHNGEGDYRISIHLPSKDKENYYYDLTTFKVYNVNPAINHDITYSPSAQDVDLNIQNPDTGYIVGNEAFTLTGEITSNGDNNEIMVELKKDGDTWKQVIPVENGMFNYDIPLFYGKGVHQLKVYVPDKEKDNYFQEGTILYIDNESDLFTEPIIYTAAYEERGLNLESPISGGDEADLTYRIQGSIDKDAPFAKETTHLYITTKKDRDESLEVIPVDDYKFDDEFYLRFGPGTYKITVSVPEIKDENSSRFYYQHAAEFTVENTASTDERDLLPSRGIESDAPEITTIADDLIKDSMSDRDKAKAVYEYTAKTVSYDVDKLNEKDFNWDDSALKTLDLKAGVCQDYAYLAIALLRAGDMEARYIHGTAGSGFNHARHAWVEVKVDGEWLTMDPTWGAGYIEKGTFVADYSEDYFDPTEEAIDTHFRAGVEY